MLQKANIPIPKHSHRSSGGHRKGDENTLFTLYNIPECITALSIHLKKKKEFSISPGPGEQIGVGKRERGGYEPSPVAVSGPPTPSPGPVRSEEIRSLERSEVIGREDCWREISIHYTRRVWIEEGNSKSARQQQRGFDSRYTRCGEKD